MSPQRDTPHTENTEPNTQPSPAVDETTSNVKKQKPNDSEESHHSNIPGVRKFFQRNSPTPQGFFNLVVMVATVCLTLVTKWQYDVQRLDQRAWVGVHLHPEAHELKINTPTRLAVVIDNSGKTPAINMTGRMTAQGVYKGTEFEPAYVTDAARRGVAAGSIQPGSQTGMGMVLEKPDERITQGFASDMQSGLASYYVYGQVEYVDVFGDHHCHLFCYVYETDLKYSTLCPTYNKAIDAKCENEENKK